VPQRSSPRTASRLRLPRIYFNESKVQVCAELSCRCRAPKFKPTKSIPFAEKGFMQFTQELVCDLMQ